MAFRKVNDDSLATVADAIRAKGGTSEPLGFPDGFVNAISEIQAGGGGSTTPSAKWNDVTFIDYDGSVLYSYTLAEAKALTELPQLPEHDGLICQGWNWSLGSIKALNREVTVGAMYITDDGKTRLKIRVWDTARSNVPLYFSQTVAKGVTIEWGDGSATETLAGTGNVNTTHQYTAAGDYTISLSVAGGCTLGFGHNKSDYCVMGRTGEYSRVYCNLLQNVQIGWNVTSIGTSAFQYCSSLVSIAIPDSVTSIGTSAFQYCSSLASIAIPDSVTSIGTSAFWYCSSLVSIAIPDSVTSIGTSAFQYCSSLASIAIPDSVTSIGTSAFRYCSSLVSIAIPDSVTSIRDNAFWGCSSLASIAIPDSVTSIGNSAFQNCYTLVSIAIPDGVTSIGNSAFHSCYGMGAYHLKPTKPPTLSSTNAFSNIPSDCVIYVPAGCLEAYQTATNWTTYASKMQEEPA